MTPNEWKTTCEDFKTNNYCTTSGEYGSGWHSSWTRPEPPFDYLKNTKGETPLNCPQCGCVERQTLSFAKNTKCTGKITN